MDLTSFRSSTLVLTVLILSGSSTDVWGATFTFVNKCDYTVWPGILANAGSPKLDTTGFQLPTGATRSFLAPTGWSGRFWARTGCNFDDSGSGSCSTGDCGTGQVECNGLGASPPVTLAEFTLGSGGLDFYDVSLVDGYNLPMIIEGSGGSGQCGSTGCLVDLNQLCPKELKSGAGDACKSACEAFGSPEYCCSGAFNTPDTCHSSVYSEMFKSACPRSYSYAYDDATSTFTCSGADYTMTFCASSSPSQKASKDTTPIMQTPPTLDGSESGSLTGSSGSEPMTDPGASSGAFTVTGSGGGSDAMLTDGSWLAGLAMGDSTRTRSFSVLHSLFIAFSSLFLLISSLHL